MICLGSTRRRRVFRGGPPRSGTPPPRAYGPTISVICTEAAARGPVRPGAFSAVDHGLSPLKAKIWLVGLMDETRGKPW